MLRGETNFLARRAESMRRAGDLAGGERPFALVTVVRTEPATSARVGDRAVGPMQPPPTQPSRLPSGKMIARSPIRAEVEGSVRTTVTTANGRPVCASSPARRSDSARRARELGTG